MLVVVVLALVAVGWAVSVSYVRIPEGKAGLKVRAGQAKWRAVVLRPGPHWRVPLLDQVEVVQALRVPVDMIGLVTAREGAKRPAGRLFSQFVDCDDFQDGAAFLRDGGELGLQVTVLRSDQVYYLNPHLFEVRQVPRTWVPDGSIGLVIARAGGPLPTGRLFGQHVQCDDFQDGAAFINGGGQQGRQLAILATGGYDINPALFQVVTTANVEQSGTGLTARQLRVISFDVGFTGVVITADGTPPERDAQGTQVPAPPVDGHQNYRLPWVFLDGGGRQGIQRETLPGGVLYSLNPWFVSVVLVPVRLVTLEWTKRRQHDPNRYDAELDPIITYIDGHKLTFEMTQTIRVPERVAPRLVNEFGAPGRLEGGGLIDDAVPIQRFVEKILGGTIAAYFTRMTATTTGEQFRASYPDLQAALALEIHNALEPWAVEATTTVLSHYEVDDPEFQTRMRMAYAEEAAMLDLRVRKATLALRDELDQAELRHELRRAELQLRALVDILGPADARLIRVIQELTQMKVPSYIGGGDLDRILGAMPVPLLTELVSRLEAVKADPQGPDPGGRSIIGTQLPDDIEDGDS